MIYGLIPSVGCTGCISEAQLFFYSNRRASDHLFIFTGIDDLKMFKREIPDSLHQGDNIIIDKDNDLMSSGFSSIYPSYININNNTNLTLETFQSK